MQNYTIRFVESLIARISASGCSIASALEVELMAVPDERALLKLRDAALDLARVVELEIGRRQPDCDCAEKGWRSGHAPGCHEAECVDCGAKGEHHCPAFCDIPDCDECYEAVRS
jgi:hypothetical protein